MCKARGSWKRYGDALANGDALASGDAAAIAPLHGVLCFVGADWPLLFARALDVRGVPSCGQSASSSWSSSQARSASNASPT